MIDGTLRLYNLLKPRKNGRLTSPWPGLCARLTLNFCTPRNTSTIFQPPGLPAYASFLNKARLKHQAFIAIIADYNGQMGVQAQPKVVFLRILSDWPLPRIAPDADFLLLFGGIGRAWWRRIQCQSEAA